MERKNYFDTMKNLINKVPFIKNYQKPKQYINLKSNDYYTQRNNPYKKLSACQPTSRVMFYIGNNINLSHIDTKGDALDNYFMKLLDSEEAHEFANKNFHSLYEETGQAPYEIHDMYPLWLDKKLFGKQVSKFLYKKASWNDYINWIKEGKVIQTSGKMPRVGGHGFCVIGYDEFDNKLRLADPYGNFNLHYENDNPEAIKGYLIPMSEADFQKYIHGPVNQKFAHIPL
jgi:hypothetical protein